MATLGDTPLSTPFPTGGGLFDAYALIAEVQTSGTNGGTFTSGAWRTRILNTESSDPDGIVSIASNQFTLQAGTYWIYARAPGFMCNVHKAKLANITDTTDDLIGSSCYAGSGSPACTDSIVQGRVTIASAKVFEIQHRCSDSKSTDGFGPQSGLSVSEIYTQVQIWRET